MLCKVSTGRKYKQLRLVILISVTGSGKHLAQHPKRLMADQGTSPPPSPSHEAGNSRRKATRLRDLAKRRSGGQKTPLDIDVATGVATGPNATTFQSYLGFLVREHVSILTPSWDKVTPAQKDMLWQDVLVTFEIPNTNTMKKKVLSSMATKFRQFKSILTSTHIYEKEPDQISKPDYASIDDETWKQFVQSRLSQDWQGKRKKAKETQSKNTTPHVLSRGGYKLLNEKLIQEKVDQRSQASGSDPTIAIINPPSPPSRHDKWKKARMRKSGEYTSSDAKSIAEKIDSLVEQCSQGSFAAEGRKDILTVAIGKDEHPGRVRAAGHGVGFKQFFGRTAKRPAISSSMDQDSMDQMRASLKEELRAEITEELMQAFEKRFGMQLRAVSQATPSEPKQTGGPSTKGSCSPDGHSVDDGEQCALYVDEQPIRMVAVGRVVAGGDTIHCKKMAADEVRVTVEEAHDKDAPVPLPTEEVQLVGQALNTFISWPKHLIKPLPAEVEHIPTNKVSSVKVPQDIDDPLQCLNQIALNMGAKTIAIPWNPEIFGKESQMPLYIHATDCVEMCGDMDKMTLAHMQLWIMFMHKLCIELGCAGVYGFLEPQSITGLADSLQARTYVVDWMGGSNKRIYFGPYLTPGHWQLIVFCPKDHVVAFFCSVNRPIPEKLKQVLTGIHVAYHSLTSNNSRARPKLKILQMQCNQQGSKEECGFYVMQWMETIIRMGIQTSWAETFQNKESFDDEAIVHTRKQWASFLLECKKHYTIDD